MARIKIIHVGGAVELPATTRVVVLGYQTEILASEIQVGDVLVSSPATPYQPIVVVSKENV